MKETVSARDRQAYVQIHRVGNLFVAEAPSLFFPSSRFLAIDNQPRSMINPLGSSDGTEPTTPLDCSTHCNPMSNPMSSFAHNPQPVTEAPAAHGRVVWPAHPISTHVMMSEYHGEANYLASVAL